MFSRPVRRVSNQSSLALAVAAVLAGSLPVAMGATWEWDGVTGLWSVGANWSTNTVPTSAANTALVFGGNGSADYIATHDLVSPFELNALTFAGTVPGNIHLTGNAFQFVGNATQAPTISQNGLSNVSFSSAITLSEAVNLSGTGSGLVSFEGILAGAGGLNVTSGHWQLRNSGNSFTGGLNILGGTVEVRPLTGPTIVRRLATSYVGELNSNLTLNGGTFKVTTHGMNNTAGTGGHMELGGFPITFGPNGGTVDLRNSNPDMPLSHSGTIGYYNGAAAQGGGNLVLNLTNTEPAVVQFNGGQLGFSDLVNPFSGDWKTGENALRFGLATGTGPLRVELSNGALARAGFGNATLIDSLTTYRGVQGGDPTSGVSGTVNTGFSRDVGRVLFDRTLPFSYAKGVIFEDALQVAAGFGSAAVNGNITLAGNAGGHPAYVAFAGRASGTGFNSTIHDRGVSAVGQNVLWVGYGADDSLKVEDGAVAVFDARIRADQGNHHGVLLDARAVLEAGGTLRVAQSLSNFTQVPDIYALANVADIILRGDVEGKGTTENDAVLDLRLPAPSESGTIIGGVPKPIAGPPLGPNERPFGGLVAEAAHQIIINGSGLGGLRVESNARPDALFSATGIVGGPSSPDPTSNLTKLNDYLTPSRLAAITGSGGYLTAAPIGYTWSFPSGGEWSNAVSVGLRVSNHNPAGVDVSFAGLTGFQHNVAVSAGATLDLGSAPFTYGPAVATTGLGTLNGLGTVNAPGGLTVAIGGRIGPGLGQIGEFTFNSSQVSVQGAVEIEASTTASDLVRVVGNLLLDGTSQLIFPAGTILAPRSYKIAIANSRTGTFGTVNGLPAGFAVDYSRPDEVWLKFTGGRQVTWAGAVNSNWNKTTQNWSGPTAFIDTDSVLFNDTAPVSRRTVSISGGDVSPNEIEVNTSGTYTLISNLGSAITGYGQLIKNGSGTLLLSGPAAFEGGLTVNSGAVHTLVPNSIPDIGKVRVAAGADLNLNGAETIEHLLVSGSVTSNAPLTVGALTLTDAEGFNAPLVLQGKLTKSGVPLTLTNTIDLAGGVRTFQVEVGADPGLRLSGAVSNGGIIKTGPGTLDFNAVNSFTGGLLIEAGTVRTSMANALPADGAVTIQNGATLDLSGLNQSIGALVSDGTITLNGASLTVARLHGASGNLHLGSGELIVAQSLTSRYDGNIAGTGSVTKTGVGSLGLGGNNTFSGGLNVFGGTVRLLSEQAAGSGPIPIHVAEGGALAAAAAVQVPITLAGGIFGSRINGQEFSASYADVFAAPGTLSTILLADPDEPTVSSEMVLDGALRGTGNIFVQSGINADGADRNTGFRLRGAGMSDFSGVITIGNQAKFELQSAVAGPFSPAGSGTIVMAAGTYTADRRGTYSQLTLRNQLGLPTTFGNNVEVTGTGLVSFNPVTSLSNIPANSDLGVVMGNLRVLDGQVIAVNKNQEPRQTVEFTSVTLTGGEVVFSPTTPGFGFDESADLVLGAITETVPGSGILMDGEGKLTLLGGNTYTGSTRILRGTTVLGGPAALSPGSRLRVEGGATLDFYNGTNASFNQTIPELSGVGSSFIKNTGTQLRDLIIDQDSDTTYEGVIEGSLNLVKQGSGTLRLVGNNIHEGTTVAEGTLSVSDSFTSGSISGAVSVLNGATLTGFGAVGDVTVAGGGHLVPGNSAGILSTEDLLLQDGSILEFELNGNLAGSGYDQIDTSGSVTLNGLLALDLQLAFDPIDGVDALTLILNGSNGPILGGGRFVYGENTLENGEVFSLGGFIPQSFQIRYDGNDGNDVVLLAVPEPATAVLMLAGLGVLARRRRSAGSCE